MGTENKTMTGMMGMGGKQINDETMKGKKQEEKQEKRKKGEYK